jgi:hypothetical protein
VWIDSITDDELIGRDYRSNPVVININELDKYLLWETICKPKIWKMI